MHVAPNGLVGGPGEIHPSRRYPVPVPTPPASTTIEDEATKLLGQFDRNEDGALRVTGKPEFERQAPTRGGKRSESIERLARAADAVGNQDGSATESEMTRIMSSFDTGFEYAGMRFGTHDDRLTGAEYSAFLNLYGPESSSGGMPVPSPRPMPIPMPGTFPRPGMPVPIEGGGIGGPPDVMIDGCFDTQRSPAGRPRADDPSIRGAVEDRRAQDVSRKDPTQSPEQTVPM